MELELSFMLSGASKPDSGLNSFKSRRSEAESGATLVESLRCLGALKVAASLSCRAVSGTEECDSTELPCGGNRDTLIDGVLGRCVEPLMTEGRLLDRGEPERGSC